jgi:hypothetical protein
MFALGYALSSEEHAPHDTVENARIYSLPERHIAGIKAFIDAGYDHIYVHQIGPDQEGFFRFYEQEVLSKL